MEQKIHRSLRSIRNSYHWHSGKIELEHAVGIFQFNGFKYHAGKRHKRGANIFSLATRNIRSLGFYTYLLNQKL